MSKLFSILKGIALLILIIYIIGFFLPGKAHLERSANIPAAVGQVHHYINDLRNWEKWSPWHRMDSNMKINYSDNPVGQSAFYTWESKVLGNGKTTILESNPEMVKTKLEFDGMGEAYGTFLMKPDNDSTFLTWQFDGDATGVPFYMKPVHNIFSLFMDKLVGKDYDQGLANIKLLAAQSKDHGHSGTVNSIIETKIPETHFIQTETSCSINELNHVMEALYTKLGKFLQENKLSPSSPPLATYPGFKPGDTMIHVIALFPIEKACTEKSKDGISCGSWLAQKTVKANYIGPYEGTQIAYDEIEKYCRENHLTFAGDPYEEYVSDPMKEKDVTKLITNIYWPVK
ncbi:MAG: SRPBCC family protein [Saprospiraceae bacterium]|jgi:effector-binding domain-containing protein|nr:SRPBCC family protein [Saprospiraceae bacterium]